MFIHWGAYSAAARGEWVYNRERIGKEEYLEKYVKNFKAENYNPDEWTQLAKDVGMKYVVLTAKHHDGFCLWNTKTTDYNAAIFGPKKDLVAEYVNAVRRAGLKVGIYYSPADWAHPDYPDAYSRDWPLVWDDEVKRKRFVAFYTEQLRELMTNYGKIDILWYDGCLPQPLDGNEVNAMVRSLQPEILISARNGSPYDFSVCEQAIVPPKDDRLWEACMTLNDNWGYHAGDSDYKSPREVVKMLLSVAQGGGNLLLNVGPKSDGTIPEQSVEILEKVGKWLKVNGDAIYGSEKSPFSHSPSHMITVKGNRIYIHVIKRLSEICVAEIKNPIKRMFLLQNGEDCQFNQTEEGRLFVSGIPDTEGTAVTLVCETEGKPEPIVKKGTFWIPGQD